jgi:DNA-binding protein WhiA
MESEISFSQKIKEELSTATNNSDEKNLGLLSAFIKINGSLRIHEKNYILMLQTENAKTAKFIYSLLEKYFDCDPRFVYQKKEKLNKKTNYILTIGKNVEKILNDLHIDFLNDDIEKTIENNEQKYFGYIDGAFLACGSCNSPTSSNYHLELSLVSSTYATSLQSLINHSKKFNFNMRLIKRRNNYVIYIKKSDLISCFLIMIGAVECCMDFESVRVDRDYSNTENRLINLDGANMLKTYESSNKQLENIKFIDDKVGINNLNNDKVILFCKVRLENPDSSMKEISEIMSERYGAKVSKGQVYHIIKKVEDFAIKYGKERDK